MKLSLMRLLTGLLIVFSVFSVASYFDKAEAVSARKINARVQETLDDFVHDVRGGQAALNKAKGVLVMPKVYNAGFGIGGQYGEGALRVGGKTVNYYNLIEGSVGFQLGGQMKRIVILFMEDSALQKFRNSNGFQVGADASVAVVTVGAEGGIDSASLNKPVIAFVLDQKGLMYDLSLDGAKFSKIARR